MATSMFITRGFFLKTRSFTQKCSIRHNKNLSIKDILRDEPIGSVIYLRGWVQAIRKQKENVFLEINDGSCIKHVQVVTDAKMPSVRQLTFGSSVVIRGELVRSTHPAQSVELKPLSIDHVGSCSLEDYPFEPRKMHPPDYTRHFPHLRSKTRTFAAILRSRNAALMAFHEFYQKRDFVFVNTPVITSNDCEGAGEVFTVFPLAEKKLKTSDPSVERYFDKEAYLTVSSQFHLEAISLGMTNIYTLGPCFRAENSKSRHHLAEFYMLEAEMAFVLTLDHLLSVVEDMLKCVTKTVLERCFDDVQFLHNNGARQNTNEDVHKLLDNGFVRLSYDEALNILNQYNDIPHLKWGQDLLRVHEQWIVKHCGNVPVFVTHYPSSLKPFYMKTSKCSTNMVEAFDLLVPVVGELCGGSLREDDINVMKERLIQLNLSDTLQWYLDLRKFGGCPHGGFGLGFDRFVQFLLGINSIKDTISFPCYPHHCPH